MFYDERINEEQGRAFRGTVILGWGLLLLFQAAYSWIISATGLVVSPRGHFSLPAVSVGIIVGAVIILFGEIRYGFRPRDEMAERAKNKYYSRAFYVYLYAVVIVYCIAQVPIWIVGELLSSVKSGEYTDTMAYLATPCWLFMLTCFKKNEVPLNVSFLSVSRREYWGRVLAKAGTFLGIVTVLTSLSAAVCMMQVSSPGVFLAVFLRGLGVGLSLSVWYLIFSFAERSSEKAKLEGRISNITLIFGGAAVVLYILQTLITWWTVIAFDLIGSAFPNPEKAVITVQLAKQAVAYLETYAVGFFAIYLYSELKHLKQRGLFAALSVFIGVQIGAHALSDISLMTSVIGGYYLGKNFVLAQSYITLAISYVSAAVLTAALLVFIGTLVKLKKLKPGAYALAFVMPLMKIAEALAVNVDFSIMTGISSAVITAVYAAMMLWVFKNREDLVEF